MWHIFQKSSGGLTLDKYLSGLYVKAAPDGTLSLSARLYEVIGHPSHVSLATDDAFRVGLIASNQDDPNAYKVTGQGFKNAKHWYRVSAPQEWCRKQGLSIPGKLVIWLAIQSANIAILSPAQPPADVLEYRPRVKHAGQP